MNNPVPVNILLVDDQPANLLALETVLEKLDETLISVTSGEEALRKVLGTDFAAILLDVRMPTMSGFETARLIRTHPRSSRTPIIFLTAAPDDPNFPVDEAYALGAVDYLTKPIVPAVLQAKVSFFVDLYRKTADLARIERERHMAALNEKDARIRLLLGNIKDYAFVVTDVDGRISEWEGGAEEITGWRAVDAIGQSAAILYLPEDCLSGRPEIEMAEAKDNGRSEDKRWHARKDGSRFYADGVTIALNDAQGQLRGFTKIFRDATAAKQAADDLRMSEERLRQSRERVKLATEAAGLGVWLWDAPTGLITWENDRLNQALGIPPLEASTIAAEFARRFLHSEDAPAFLQALEDMTYSGAVFHLQARVSGPAKEPRWLEFSGLRQRTSAGDMQVLGMAADITARKQVEQREREAAAEAFAAAEANAKFRTFFDQGSYFAGVMALDGTIIEANRLCLEACGFTREEVVGKKFWDCGWWNRSPELMDMVRSGYMEAVAGNTFKRETVYFVADGSQRFIELILAPVTDSMGRVLYVAPTGTDVTDRKRAADDLRRLAADLAEADRRKTEFLATLAHELRNPLAPLQNGLEIMRLAADNPEVVGRTRDMMERQLAHMVHLVDDLLDVARITRGKVHLKKEKVELKNVVASAIETSMPQIQACGHQLVTQLEEASLLLDADPTRLSQIISNLLNNAAKYTSRGGRIILSACRENNEIAITVTDNGVGIPPEMLPTVFEMFTQVSQNLNQAQGGLGIGLTLVRRLTELHGGTITAASAGSGKGSSFTVRLPFAQAREERPAPTNKPVVPIGNSGRRVLVVDDNSDVAESLSALLQVGGYTTRVANDAMQTFEMAREFMPEVVFLDIGMPGMNGYEVARALRKTPGMEHVVLVALSGWGNENDRSRSRAAGFDEHLTKPAGLAAVNRLLSKLSWSHDSASTG
ncbi:response regulator [Noviherbaspirillum saxi]|uniref:response regulator n=1 Tax=Noviherbaspirillum saxi TaxID=2320863 RepID=UPI0013143FE0|nr:response regulator [Noviherbaspirillum saxi]